MFYKTRFGRYLLSLIIACAILTIASFFEFKQKKISIWQYNSPNDPSELWTLIYDLSLKQNMAMRKIGQLNCKMAEKNEAVAETGNFPTVYE